MDGSVVTYAEGEGGTGGDAALWGGHWAQARTTGDGWRCCD